MSMQRLRLSILLLMVAWVSLPAGETCVGDRLSGRQYSVNLVPRQPPTELYRIWSPLLERIGIEHGLCFDIRIFEDFQKFENAMHAGETDFIFLNPYHQVMVHETPGYLPLIRDEESRLAGILVVAAESTITSIYQLEGKTIAFPAPNAYVASLLIRSMLANKGIDIEPKYIASHSNVLRSVALRVADAGGAANNTLEYQPDSLKSRLHILYQSPFYMPHPFSAHPRVAENDQEKVIKGFIALTKDSEGRKMLSEVQMTRPVRANYDRDYKELEQLELEHFIEAPSDANTP
ncbi:MAG: phosphate/phosphite/phosphonate ABC transporter substrate-binding protein [Candidatus Thiodiazotropha sp.]